MKAKDVFVVVVVLFLIIKADNTQGCGKKSEYELLILRIEKVKKNTI